MKIKYSLNDYKQNLIKFWRQFYPDYEIPDGFHVHHIKPKCTFEDKDDLRIHHPRNLIALHPDDHLSIHKMRGDKRFLSNGKFILQIAGMKPTSETRKKMSASQSIAQSKRARQPNYVNPRKGIKILDRGPSSIETKQKIKDGMANMSTDAKASHATKIAIANINKVQSTVTKNKIRKFRIGKKLYNNGVINKVFTLGDEDAGFILGKLTTRDVT